MTTWWPRTQPERFEHGLSALQPAHEPAVGGEQLDERDRCEETTLLFTPGVQRIVRAMLMAAVSDWKTPPLPDEELVG